MAKTTRFKTADETVIGGVDYSPQEIAGVGHNRPPEEIAAEEYAALKAKTFKTLDDLYDEARNFADGEAITSEELHDATSNLVSQIKAAGKVIEEMRVAEKLPLDVAVKAIQDEFNPYVQKDKGKVDKAVKALNVSLTAWRIAEAARKQKIADAIAAEAAEKRRAAEAAIQVSAGNLLDREDAEDELKEAKLVERDAKRADKAATTGLGLVTVRVIEIADKNAALDWAFDFDRERLYLCALDMAKEHVQINKLDALAGFTIRKEQRAR